MPPPTAAHGIRERKDAVSHPNKIDPEHPVKGFWVHIGERTPVRCNPGVVNEDVDRTKPRLGFLFCSPPTNPVAYVQRYTVEALGALRQRGSEQIGQDIGDCNPETPRC